MTGVISGGITTVPAQFPLEFSVVDGYLAGPGVDLAGVDLAGEDLTGVDLAGADLTDDTLTGTDLTNANLTGATMTGVISGGITTVPAQFPLEFSVVDGYLAGPGANLSGADLAGVDLAGVDYSKIDLAGAKLDGADFSGADLLTADLSSADLIGADMSGADFIGAELTDANLSDADLRDAFFISPTATDADFSGANLAGANLAECRPQRCQPLQHRLGGRQPHRRKPHGCRVRWVKGHTNFTPIGVDLGPTVPWCLQVDAIEEAGSGGGSRVSWGIGAGQADATALTSFPSVSLAAGSTTSVGPLLQNRGRKWRSGHWHLLALAMGWHPCPGACGAIWSLATRAPIASAKC